MSGKKIIIAIIVGGRGNRILFKGFLYFLKCILRNDCGNAILYDNAGMVVFAYISAAAKYIEYSRVADRLSVSAAYVLFFEISIHLFAGFAVRTHIEH